MEAEDSQINDSSLQLKYWKNILKMDLILLF